MRFLTQACKVFDGCQPARKTENHIDGNQPTQLQPGKSRTVNSEPQRLPDNHVCLGRFFTRKAAMKKIYDRQNSTGDCHQSQDKKAPARPYVGKGLCDEEIESTPANDHEHKRGETKWFESELFIH